MTKLKKNENCLGSLPTEQTTGQYVQARQKNHGSWYLPAGLPLSGEPPLWLAVAYWGLQQGGFVTRNEVATVFRISARQATDVLTYVLEHRSDLVKIKREIVWIGRGHRVARYLITEIIASPDCSVRHSQHIFQGSGPITAAKRRQQERNSLAEARRAFLFQRKNDSLCA